MKKLILMAAVCFVTKQIAAQTDNGIYLSENDFATNHLSYASPSTKIIAESIFSSETIQVKTKGEKLKLSKQHVYGYQLDGAKFRLVNGKAFQIINPTEEVWIYVREEFPKGKSGVKIKKYYFSKTANSPLYELTLQQVKQQFGHSDQAQFIDVYFHQDADLLKFDEVQQHYLINRIN